jgi:Domain of unknown function (DUF4864)
MEEDSMDRRTQMRWAVGTLAAVAMALSIDSVWRTRGDLDAVHSPQKVIRRQLDAFNRDDYGTAYRFAAPEIQAQFSLPQFQQMVQQGYPQVAHSRSAEFGPPEREQDTVVVPLTVTGRNGVIGHYLYVMRREKGEWRVAGVEGDHIFQGLPGLRKTAAQREGEKPAQITAAPRLHNDR